MSDIIFESDLYEYLQRRGETNCSQGIIAIELLTISYVIYFLGVSWPCLVLFFCAYNLSLINYISRNLYKTNRTSVISVTNIGKTFLFCRFV